MSASQTDRRVYTQAAPTDLRWVDDHSAEVRAEAKRIQEEAAQRMVVKIVGPDCADLLAVLFTPLKGVGV